MHKIRPRMRLRRCYRVTLCLALEEENIMVDRVNMAMEAVVVANIISSNHTDSSTDNSNTVNRISNMVSNSTDNSNSTVNRVYTTNSSLTISIISSMDSSSLMVRLLNSLRPLHMPATQCPILRVSLDHHTPNTA